MNNKIFQITKTSFLRHKHNLPKTKWTNEEDKKLKETIYKYGDMSWKLISEHFEKKTPSQIKSHWKMKLDPSIKKGKWTEEEDNILKNLVNQYGQNNWHIFKKYLTGRTSKQIRDRYINQLSLKGPKIKWDNNSDKQLLTQYMQIGNQWNEISKSIAGTTGNMIKNRFYSMLRKIANEKRRKNMLIDIYYKKLGQTINNNEMETDSDISALQKNNPYEIEKRKSLYKNYSLGILIKFLPELLEKKGINVDKYSQKYKSIEEENKRESIQTMFDIISRHLFKNFDDALLYLVENYNKKEEIQICSPIESQTKSSILFNMQIGQLGFVFENVKQGILHKYFLRFRKNINK